MKTRQSRRLSGILWLTCNYYDPNPGSRWGFVISGDGMSTTSADELTELDEALRHLSLVPDDERGPAWRAYCDAILERRRKMENL